MNRREALHHLSLASGGLALQPAVTLAGQRPALPPIAPRVLDASFVWQWRIAQRQRPAVIDATTRLAEPDESGQPLTIRGQLFHVDGWTPAAHAIVFAYHTDQTGVYTGPGTSRARPWRLRGWARTNAEGRFTFHTVRPAPYPTRDDSAHVHLTADGPGIVGQVVESLRFADDELNTGVQREASAALGRFGYIRPVVNGACDLNLRLTGEWPF